MEPHDGPSGHGSAIGTWTRHWSRSKQAHYWQDSVTRDSLWEDAQLPSGWAWGRAGNAVDGAKEYVHLASGARQMQPPASAPTPPSSQPLAASAASAVSATSAAAAAADTASSTAATPDSGTSTEAALQTPTLAVSVQARGMAAQAGDDLASTAYIPDEAGRGANVPRPIASKRDYLFRALVPPDLLWRLQVDDVALYSITEGRQAERMTDIILTELRRMAAEMKLGATATAVAGPPASPGFVLTDATACVGGNTISFARSPEVARVHAVEISGQRANMLRHNVDVLGLSGKVTVHCADYCRMAGLTPTDEATPAPRQDCVFMDPPWGGPEYKDAAVLDMFLGPHNVADLVVFLLSSAGQSTTLGRDLLVAIKAPLNYNVAGVRQKLDGAKMADASLAVIPMHKMQLLLIRRPLGGAPTMATQPGGEGAAAPSSKRIADEAVVNGDALDRDTAPGTTSKRVRLSE